MPSTMANSVKPRSARNGCSRANPNSMKASQAGAPRYMAIASNSWQRLTGSSRGNVSSCRYCMLPWHQRRSRRMNSSAFGGFSSQLPSSSGSTRTS